MILDDIENDENVKSPRQRDKLESWIAKAVMKLGPTDGTMDVLYAGTVLHFDAVIERFAAADAPVKGWAMNPAAVGEATAVIAIGMFRCKAAAVVAAGQVLVSGATKGTVQPAGATPVNPIGRALNAAAVGGYVDVLVR